MHGRYLQSKPGSLARPGQELGLSLLQSPTPAQHLTWPLLLGIFTQCARFNRPPRRGTGLILSPPVVPSLPAADSSEPPEHPRRDFPRSSAKMKQYMPQLPLCLRHTPVCKPRRLLVHWRGSHWCRLVADTPTESCWTLGPRQEGGEASAIARIKPNPSTGKCKGLAAAPAPACASPRLCPRLGHESLSPKTLEHRTSLPMTYLPGLWPLPWGCCRLPGLVAISPCRGQHARQCWVAPCF